jgi:tRNA threonylcarbamoyladenosine biosynthesis protein TsaB
VLRVLAIDGALGNFSVAVASRGEVRVYEVDPAAALERGLGAVDAALREARLRLGELDRIAVGIGPGRYTGLRVAVSFAKSLALAADVDLVGISSYEVLEPPGLAPPPIATFVPARAGAATVRLILPGGEAVGLGAPHEQLARLLAERVAALPGHRTLTCVAAPKDVLQALGERGITVLTAPTRPGRVAEIIADLAAQRPPAASPHALAPDYGELPAVPAREPRA